MQDSAYTKAINLEFNAIDLLCIFIKVHRIALELQKMSRHQGWKETGPSQDQIFACSDNPEQNIWNKME